MQVQTKGLKGLRKYCLLMIQIWFENTTEIKALHQILFVSKVILEVFNKYFASKIFSTDHKTVYTTCNALISLRAVSGKPSSSLFNSTFLRATIVPVFLCCEIFSFFSSRSLKMREKYNSFAQFVYFLVKVCFFDIIVNLIIQKLKSKHTFHKKHAN